MPSVSVCHAHTWPVQWCSHVSGHVPSTSFLQTWPWGCGVHHGLRYQQPCSQAARGFSQGAVQPVQGGKASGAASTEFPGWAQFGLFHGDPHPGNIFALRDGRIAYVDFGNVAELSQQNKQVLIDAVVHAVNNDYESMANDFIKLVRPQPVLMCGLLVAHALAGMQWAGSTCLSEV